MISQVFAQAGLFFGHNLQSRTDAPTKPHAPGELECWFDEHSAGDGVWKWRHYFDIYERHFRKFVGREVHVLEIGIYSGGSLEMWREYFGDGLHLYGVDIAPEVVAYESDQVKILVGDQGDPNFWARAMAHIPKLDVVIDDGGHQPHQQCATLEALLPVLSPGGVFLCEDIHDPRNEFWNYVNGLERNLHHWDVQAVGPDREATIRPTNFQRLISSVHQYPYVVVLERRASPSQRCSQSATGPTGSLSTAVRMASAPTSRRALSSCDAPLEPAPSRCKPVEVFRGPAHSYSSGFGEAGLGQDLLAGVTGHHGHELVRKG